MKLLRERVVEMVGGKGITGKECVLITYFVENDISIRASMDRMCVPQQVEDGGRSADVRCAERR